jgi:hypothetical protein
MRDPVGGIVPGMAVTIFSGNQFQGGGTPGNQLQAGSRLVFKRAADADWASLPLLFHSASGNNKYYAATIPTRIVQTGEVVQYYLRIAYDDHVTTFVHAQDGTSIPTADEAAARAAPFTFPVGPSGTSLAFDSGPVQARIYPDTGHIEIAGPDLAGATHAVAVTFAVMATQRSGRTGILGRVVFQTWI